MRSLRICFMGESFVNGTGDLDCLGWAGRICANACRLGHDITYYNLGVRRETSTQLKERWFREVSYRLPLEQEGRIIFCFGANDTTIENGKTRVAFETSLENTCNILKVAKQMFPVLMVGTAPVVDLEQNQRIARLSVAFGAICNEINVPYLDIFTPLQASEVWISEAIANDGAHPRAAGYTQLAQLVQNWQPWLSWFK
ncbi:lipase [Chlorogloea sp. CCALA 695]|nr:lipase [Chlorogloea sp. CCALA 695]